MAYPYHSICVFCGSADGLAPVYYTAAYEMGELLARNGITLVYGAGRTGMMGALAEGALGAGGEVIGIVPNGLESPQLIYTTGLTRLEVVTDIQLRKARMNALADAFITLPGGYGTMDEMFEVLTLIQTQKVTRKFPVILFGREFWSEVINFKALAKWGVISPEDINLFHVSDSVEEVRDYIIADLTARFLDQG